ncbi:proline racemase [Halobacteriales archaeon QH_3_68_24]|nr:MAG: proline racemase [Halobacteriales archaeon QH_1_68_42]PSP53942.1 MAG: proline racemase [Halobacteriales archaeon QH_3_68_24]
MRTEYLLDTIDTHTAGEPTRILTGGVDWQSRGQTVKEQMERFEATHDDVRRMLMNEPRGHADMFGAVPVEPSAPDADLGVFYITPYGYGDMCGHANIGLVTAFIETGRLSADDTIRLETPVDVIDVSPEVIDGRVERVGMENVESFVFDQVTVDVADLGPVTVEIVYSGIFFVMIDASQLEPALARENVDRLSELALRIRDTVTDAVDIVNPLTGEPARVIDTQFYERGDPERSLVVYPDGSVDRSPCGTGTCAKATLFAEWGELDAGESFVNHSLLGTEFEGRVVERSERDGLEVTTPAVAGSAHIVAKTTHTLDPTDPLVGFRV